MTMPRYNAARPSVLLAALGACALILAFALAAYAVHAQGQEVTATAAGAPRNLSARIVEGGVALRWSAPAEDAGSVTGYEILRRRPKQGERTLLTLVSDTGATDTTYTDATATAQGERYNYRVKAIRGGQRSLWSKPAVVVLPTTTTNPPPPLISNTGQSASAAFTITRQYAMGFRLGTHGQGYEIPSVSIELAEAPSSLTVSLWIGGPPGLSEPGYLGDAGHKLFDFANPPSFQVGLNKFTAPAGAFAYPYVNYYVVLSGFGSSLSINETTSNAEDADGETGAVLWNDAHFGGVASNGRWDRSSTRTSVLRLAVEGSKRDRGILASTYGQAPVKNKQEYVTVGDDCCFTLTVGAADRYLIRRLSVLADDSTMDNGFFAIPFELKEGSIRHFDLASTRQYAGINEWTAPQGSTVAGSSSYNLYMHIRSIAGDIQGSTRGGVITSRIFGYVKLMDTDDPPAYDTPTAPGVTFVETGNVTLGNPSIGRGVPLMSVDGEPLHAMVQNFGRNNNSYISLGGTNSKVVAQEFTTGTNQAGYVLQGIDVNIEGSDDSSVAQVPAGPSSVSVAVHAVVGGKTGARMFDLVSPSAFEKGPYNFFEAPPGTLLSPGTTYAVVWRHLSGRGHRLQNTLINAEDSGALSGFSIADAYAVRAGIGSLTADSDGNSLEIAVYGAANDALPALPGGYQVGRSWFHLPEDIEVGDQFRLVFVTQDVTDARSGDIENYNALVQGEAAREYNDRFIRAIAPDFKAVVCTKMVDARDNTEMRDNQGVPIHWLDGGWDDHPTLIANSYDEFHSGAWVNEEVGAIVTGNSTDDFLRHPVWTGCDAGGVAHPDAHMGTTDTMGTVAMGAPGHETFNLAPLGPIDVTSDYLSAPIAKHRRVFAISPVLTLVDRR